MNRHRAMQTGGMVLLIAALLPWGCQQNLTEPSRTCLVLQIEWDGAGYGVASPTVVDSAFVTVFQGADLVVRRAMEILDGGARGRLELEVPVGQLRVRVEGFREGGLASWGETMVTVAIGVPNTARVRMTRVSALLDMVAVQGGSFQMGSPTVGEGTERPVHTVTLSPFSISRYEVQQQQYQAVTGQNPATLQGPNRPVESVSWYVAAEFCNALSEREGYVPFYDEADLAAQSPTVAMNWDASGYRLPTEAEWEFACRAGSVTEYYWGDSIDGRFCWHSGNSGNDTHDVGTRDPNGLGLYDMSGNVSEWCNDWFDPDYYAGSPSTDPHGPTIGTFRVMRGGAYSFPDFACRSPARSQLEPIQPASICGLRPVRPGVSSQAAPEIEVSPLTLTFPFEPGESADRLLTVRNTGDLILDVHTVADDLPWLTVSPISFTLLPAASQQITATASPDADLEVSSGSIIIQSNDLHQPTVVISVSIATVGVSGLVTDAQTGSALADVRIDLTGPVTRSATTGSDGRYEFANVPDGTYRVNATRSGYITESRDVTVAGQSVTANFSLSQQLAEGQYRIVLTWGTSPNDLDSHLWVGDQYHIYYSSRGSQTTEPFAQLDRDDTSGEGPETVTIYELIADCRYAVYNFSGSPDIKTSEARVIVYSGNEVAASYDVPQSGEGRWWYVFDLSRSGVITTRDYLTSSTPGP